MRAVSVLMIALLLAVASATLMGADPPPALGQAGCAQLPSGIVSWWPAESNAADVVDSNSGTLQPETSYVTGKVGRAFHFDGKTGAVTIPANANYDFAPDGQFTIETWVNP